MHSERISWTRYWRLQKDVHGIPDAVVDEETPLNDGRSAGDSTLDELAAVPCLVLLGPPGMGKSDEIVTAHNRDTGLKVLLDFGHYDRALPLEQLISASPTVQAWPHGASVATLWIDSLEEGTDKDPNLPRRLGDEIRRLRQKVSRLRVRVACRGSDWRHTLGDTLQAIWPGEDCRFYHLVPLGETHLKLAAEQRSVSFADFMNVLLISNASHFATYPSTLIQMLLPTFQAGGALGSSKIDVHEKGCRHLAAEWDPVRQEELPSASQSAEARFYTAQFVAAALTFSGRNRLDCGQQRHPAASNAVHSREIGLSVPLHSELSDVPSIGHVEAVAKTGLMTIAGWPHLYAFLHRTTQDFLTATFLRSQSLPQSKLRTLFQGSSEQDRRIVPQLAGTAMWLAALDESFREELPALDPVVALSSEECTQDDGMRKKVFAALLEGLRSGELSYDNAWNNIRRLRFDGIEQHLLRILNDGVLPSEVREFAVRVAWHADIVEISDCLAELALDTSRPQQERELCTYALARASGTEHTMRAAQERLLPLLDATEADDPNDTLRGNALHSLWETLDPERLFSVLRPHHNPSYVGSFWSALEVIRRGLGVQHILAGLAWVSHLPTSHGLDRSFRQLMNRVFSLAWQNLEVPGVLEALAGAAATRLDFNEDVTLDDTGEDEDHYHPTESAKRSTKTIAEPHLVERRRRLCLAMVPLVAERKSGSFQLAYYMNLVQPADFEWLLEQHLGATEDAPRRVWLQLAERVWQGTPDQCGSAQRLGVRSEDVREAFSLRIALMDPDSPESKIQRSEAERYEAEHQERHVSRLKEPIDPLPPKRIDTLVSAFSHGDLNAWWQLWQWMRVDDYGDVVPTLYFEPDIRKVPHWQSANQDARAGLVACAERYVREAQEIPEEWIGKSKYHFPSAAGLSALMLLFHERRDLFDALPEGAWARWPHIILDFLNAGHDGIWADLVLAGYKASPESFRLAFKRLLQAQAQGPHQAEVLLRVRPVWDERISAVVLEVLREGDCSEAVMRQALDLLLRHGHKPARDWCIARLEQSSAPSSPGVPPLDTAVTAILRNQPTQHEWTLVWSVLGQPSRRELTMTVLGHERRRRLDMLTGLSEAQIADLYIWLRRNAPVAPVHHGVYTPGPAEAMDDVKRSALNALIQRGNQAAVDQCLRIRTEFNDDWFHRVIIAARAEARRSSWIPVAPHALWQFVANARSRLVRGERELCDAVMEALEQINMQLQGENPSAPDLWDSNGEVHKPKDERHLSNWLTRQLKCVLEVPGVFIGREIAVKLREQTDIQVIASWKEEPAFGVVIEVKGCWHRDVWTAMEKQLRDDYLAKHSSAHGVYVVGWYYDGCRKAPKGPSAKAAGRVGRALSRDEAQSAFEEQAVRLTTDSKTLRAFVLDASLLGKKPKPSGVRRTKRTMKKRGRV